MAVKRLWNEKWKRRGAVAAATTYRKGDEKATRKKMKTELTDLVMDEREKKACKVCEK